MGMIPHLFLVKYDLSGDNREKDYSKLDGVLSDLKGYRLSGTCWLVRFLGGKSANLQGYIEDKSRRGIIEGDDRLIVVKLEDDNLSVTMMRDVFAYPTTEKDDIETWLKSSFI